MDFSTGLIGFYLCAIPAVVLLGLSKGGFQGVSLLSLPLMALAVSPIDALVIMLPILMVQDVVSAWAYRRTWDGAVLSDQPAKRSHRHRPRLPSRRPGFGSRHRADCRSHRLHLRSSPAVGRLSQQVHIPSEPGTIRGIGWGMATGFTSMIAQAGGPTMQILLLPYRLHGTYSSARWSCSFSSSTGCACLPSWRSDG
jgi:uncharacterized protein